MEWETVLGLEVHAELATASKIFCSCTTAFGGEPNTHCCPICMGMPGTLPVLNRKALEYAVKAAVALGCEITRYTTFDRKNYFYPDLPKAYQISQLYLPFARGGHVRLENGRTVRIHEIHLEEDAGKLIHSPQEGKTYPDYNRCGIPLIEIVSEPDFRCAEDVLSYLEYLKAVLQDLGVSDVKMEEGSLRADVNLSVRPAGREELGTRTEMKNLNSFKAIERAIASESARQIEILESGKAVVQETRRWDDKEGKSFGMRTKEEACDYRYFPDPDLPPLEISDDFIERIRRTQPELAHERKARYMAQFHLGGQEAALLAKNKTYAGIFEKTVAVCRDPKEVAAWITGELLYIVNARGLDESALEINAEKLAEIIQMVKCGRINRPTGKQLFQKLAAEPDLEPEAYIREHNLLQIDDPDVIRREVADVLKSHPDSVAEYKHGKEKVYAYFFGQTMKRLHGKANPAAVNTIIAEELSNI